jgi:hypothetical protein
MLNARTALFAVSLLGVTSLAPAADPKPPASSAVAEQKSPHIRNAGFSFIRRNFTTMK